MKINIEVGTVEDPMCARVGNVYPVRGGRGARDGHMQVIVAITEPVSCIYGPMAVVLIVNKDGDIVGANSLSVSSMNDKQPIAFVDGIEDIVLAMRSL